MKNTYLELFQKIAIELSKYLWSDNKNNCKEIIELMHEMEKHFEKISPYCPRCGQMKRDPNIYHNAHSRHAVVYICNNCGTEEALLDMKETHLPFNEWAIISELNKEIEGRNEK